MRPLSPRGSPNVSSPDHDSTPVPMRVWNLHECVDANRWRWSPARIWRLRSRPLNGGAAAVPDLFYGPEGEAELLGSTPNGS